MTAFYLDRSLFDAPKRTARASEIEIQEISRGAVVSLQGDHVEKVILVVGGLLRLTRISVDGREVSLAYLIGGDVLTTDTVCPYQAIAEAQTLIALVAGRIECVVSTRPMEVRPTRQFEANSKLQNGTDLPRWNATTSRA